ncbi:protein FAM65C isoform X1 [Sinocyclocheilus rhinocerous]|uniref:FAM65 N-terminal domain-containing protein n=2 Tax=Sinocyclocheilus rhinocerous TaxID=307959 RepID=A0A673L331_9TELE|nr:PREDICTED: protein FAM65C isoform X1 [Sinocyclocheilus rhinocerous]
MIHSSRTVWLLWSRSKRVTCEEYNWIELRVLLLFRGGGEMSVKLKFDCPADGGMVQRSRSFTGINALGGRRRLSSARSSLRTKVIAGKSPRIPSSSRVGSSIWGQQPEQVDRIFQALRKGLKDYLENHQTELDFLSSQQRDTKRNSRLAFFYDLEKEIRALERYIRRLEFQISKVEELYESYCIQWRLCQGALNMKRAFSLSPSSRQSRESLLELNRNHRHSLEDMCAMEGELEILLGELQIKMKGLIGFARLCPGDQYEVLIRLGRQRWRIRGRIQTDDQQLWDEEEIVFLPHIHGNFEIKVTEVKGLSSILVGMVTCRSADFFTAWPQMMVVDITELGTIKLQLEVVWNPFDSSEVRPLTASTSRQSIHSRKGSVYSWTPPNTPSFTEKYFLSMMRQIQDADGSFFIGSRESRGVSLLSYLADSTQALSAPAYEKTSDPPTTHHPVLDTKLQDDNLPKTHTEDAEESVEWPSETDTASPSPAGSKRDSIFLFHRYSTPDILKQNGDVTPSTGEGDAQETALDEAPEEETSFKQGIEDRLLVKDRKVGRAEKRAMAKRVSSLLEDLNTELEDMSNVETLKKLDLQIRQMNKVLKKDLNPPQMPSSQTLAVEEEEVLGSFDFLSADCNEDEISDMGSIRLGYTGIGSFSENTLKSIRLLSQDKTSPSSKDTGEGLVRHRGDGAVKPSLSTGVYSLDQALETHLSVCRVLLRALKCSDSDLVHKDIMEELLWQVDMLEKIGALSQRMIEEISVTELLARAPKGIEVFWKGCCESDSLFCCSTDRFLRTLRKHYIHRVKAKQPGQADEVFSQLLHQVQCSCMMVSVTQCTTDRVTVFQLLVYLNRCSITDFGEHISLLSKEVYLIASLGSPKRRRALKKLKGKCISELQPTGRTLQLLAKLQTDANHKVASAATSCLSRASRSKSFRAKAVVHYTDLLRNSNMHVRHEACLALKCLKASESTEQVAELWRSTDEDLRNAARETVLSFGKKGHMAFQRMDQIYELQDEAYKNLETEITIL